MPRLRAPDRRRQLLESSLRCFAAHGFHAATTALLAEAAGVTEPVLYRHFAGKLDLFVALVDHVGPRVTDGWREAIRAGRTPAARRAALLAGPGQSAAARLLAVARAESGRDRRVRQAWIRQLRRARSMLAAELAELQRQQAVRVGAEPADLAALVISAWLGPGSSAALRALAPLLAPGVRP